MLDVEKIAPILSWIAFGLSVVVALSVWFGTRTARILLLKKRDISISESRQSPASAFKDDPVYRRLAQLREQGVEDPDVDLFIAVFENNIEGLKQALDRGARVNVTDTEVLERYSARIQGTPGVQ